MIYMYFYQDYSYKGLGLSLQSWQILTQSFPGLEFLQFSPPKLCSGSSKVKDKGLE